jgi:hypothetical protein
MFCSAPAIGAGGYFVEVPDDDDAVPEDAVPEEVTVP